MSCRFSFRLKPLGDALNAFRHDQRGAVLAETVIILPLIMWGFLALFVYFSAFATQNTAQRATYTVADLISRQEKVLTPSDIEGMNKVFDFMNDTSYTGATSHIRVSDIYYDYTDNTYRVKWSDATRGGDKLTESAVNAMSSKIPKPSNGDTEILIETWLSYQPAFDVGVTQRQFYTFFVTSPRLTPDLLFDDGTTTTNSNNPSGTTSGTNNPSGSASNGNPGNGKKGRKSKGDRGT